MPPLSRCFQVCCCKFKVLGIALTAQPFRFYLRLLSPQGGQTQPKRGIEGWVAFIRLVWALTLRLSEILHIPILVYSLKLAHSSSLDLLLRPRDRFITFYLASPDVVDSTIPDVLK